jgi:hypothetical protein
MGVLAVGGGQILHRGIEVTAASGTVVLGIGNPQVPGAAPVQIPQVMHLPRPDPQAVGTVAATRTAAVAVVAAAVENHRPGHVLNLADPLGDIGHILPGSNLLAGSGHLPLLGTASSHQSLHQTPAPATCSSALVLQSHIFHRNCDERVH